MRVRDHQKQEQEASAHDVRLFNNAISGVLSDSVTNLTPDYRVIRKLRMRSMDVSVMQIYKQPVWETDINTRTEAQHEFYFTSIDAILKYL